MTFLTAALMVFSVASSGEEVGSVAGSVKVFQEGFELSCVRVWLIPRSPQTDALINARFGASDEGVLAVPSSDTPGVKSDPPAGTRVSRCRGRFSERFGFSDVPPGDYYLTLTAAPRVRYESETQPGPTPVEMMRRVTIEPGSANQHHFRHTG